MKEIKPIEDFYILFKEFYDHYKDSSAIDYGKLIACKTAEKYHAQFATTSEEFERGKEAFISKWALGYESEAADALMLSDLDALLAMRREEKDLLTWLKDERNILLNTGQMMWHDPDGMQRTLEVANALDMTIKYIELSQKKQ